MVKTGGYQYIQIFKPKRYYDYDDIEYRGIRNVKNLFHLSTDKEYYKPERTNSAFKSNHVVYESTGDKDKILSIKEYLNMIRPYLRDITDDHKT